MASSFTTSFGIEKIGSGEQSGAWGDTTNHNIDILDRIASYKSVGLSGTTHTLTVREASPGAGTENLQDGMYRVIKFTGALGGNNTVTIAPNTSSAFFIIENATTDSGSSGPYSVILTQGSGANITVQNGKSAIVYCDGAGSGAAVVNAIADLQVATLEVTGAAAVDGLLTAGASVAVTGNVTATGTVEPAGDTAAADNAAIGYTAAEGLILTGQGSTNDVTIKNDADADVIEIPTGTVNVTMAGTLGVTGVVSGAGFTAGSAVISEAELELLDGVTAGTAIASKVVTTDANIDTTGQRNLTISGELDAATGDFSGAVDIAGALTLGGTDLAVSHGGTGAGTFAANGVIFGNGTSALGATAVGTDGHVLTSNGSGSAPTFQSAGGGITIGTPQTTGTASSVTFTGVPAGTNQIEVSYFGITFSTSAVARLRLGDSGGLETSGYLSSVGSHSESTNHTDHMALHNSGMTSAGASCVIQLSRVTGNTWSMHSVSRGNLTNSASATKALSGELTQLQIFSNTGNFTAGTIQIITE
tara:strand:- start:4485 stop:6080 length:1596 start_codon:yes stop_codon:yes gene_type:complete